MTGSSSKRPESSAVESAARTLKGATPQEILSWALDTFGGRLALASSFSIEDCVIHDMAAKIDPAVRVFALDTGRLHEETYVTAERIRHRYKTEVEFQFPERDAVMALERQKGLFSFMDSIENRHECCGIRKVDPLRAVLGTLDAWITGLRREQSVTRTDVAEVELDAANGGVVKVNPLIGWTLEQVQAYARDHNVPVHPLHEKGYPSIGCQPCTRAIKPGEHPRAGRWWWEDPEQKECGLHVAHDESSGSSA